MYLPLCGIAHTHLLDMAAATIFPCSTNTRHSVGCVDLMHNDLFIRLFYPSEIETIYSSHDNCCPWLPRIEYASGFVDMALTVMPSMPLPPADTMMGMYACEIIAVRAG